MLNKIIPNIQKKLNINRKFKLLAKHFSKYQSQSPFDGELYQNTQSNEFQTQQENDSTQFEYQNVQGLYEYQKIPDNIFINQLNQHDKGVNEFKQIMSFLVHNTTKIQKGLLLNRINYIYEQIQALERDQDYTNKEQIEFFKANIQKQVKKFLQSCNAPYHIVSECTNIDFSDEKLFQYIKSYCNQNELEFENEEILAEAQINNIKQINKKHLAKESRQKVQKKEIKLDEREFTFVDEDLLQNFQTQKKKKIKDKLSYNNLPVESINNYQQENEVIILTKEKNIKETSWILVQGLPYDFKEYDMQQKIVAALLQNGKIKQVKFFKYCDYQNETIKEIQKDELESKIDFYKKQKILLKQSQQVQNDSNSDSTVQISEPVKLSSRNSLKLKQKVKQNKFVKLNKSLALVEFQNLQDKKNFMSESLRLFGLYFDGKSHLIEDADLKHYIEINNIQFGEPLKNLMDHVNSALIELGLSTFKLDIDSQTKMISTGNIILGLGDFEESLKLQQKLDKNSFDGKTLKVKHIHGNLVFRENQLYERIIYNQNYVINSQLDKIKKDKQVLQKKED